MTPSPGPANYVGRTALAFVLCWLNPLYAIFGFFGFIDAWDALRRPWVHLGVLVVAITQAGSQSGGLPPRSGGQAGLFLALVLVNGGLASVFMKIGLRTEERNQRARAAQRRPRGRAGGERRTLHDRLVVQARHRGVEEERARLAREIHDTLAQSLAGIVTQLEAVRRRRAAGAGPRAAPGRRWPRPAARCSTSPPAPSTAPALPDALAGAVAAWSSEHGVRAEVVVVGDPAPLHPEVEATVLRIAQESLTNVAKHAGPAASA